jgi:hypothetical protein
MTFYVILSNEGMLLATTMAAKFAQNYPKLPNFAKNNELEEL